MNLLSSLPMHPTARDAAKTLRTALTHSGPTPAAFRSALTQIPARDHDAWLDLLWDADELPADDPHLPRGCVPYLPCPVSTVLEAIEQSALTCDDVFIDVGAGLGRTALLAHLLTGAGCIGLEIQPALVRAARGRASWLNLTRLRFIEGDATELVRCITIGTVFFLYCPFGRDRLERVIDDLEDLARTRPIRICCVDLPPLDRPWLTAIPSTSVNLTVYRSTLHHPSAATNRLRSPRSRSMDPG